MQSQAPVVINARAQFRGFNAAVARFRAAVYEQDPVLAYQPLFEALSWAASLDWRIGKLWAPDGKALGKDWYLRPGGAEAVPAVRWARNTVHHDWADALAIDTSGRGYPRSYPRTYFEWVWRDIEALPSNRQRDGRDIYKKLLAGKPARHTLQILSEVFEEVTSLIELPQPIGGVVVVLAEAMPLALVT